VRKNFPDGIPAFGADRLRFTFASLATFARTLNFDLNRCEGYRNFCNKLWNATRFVLMNTEDKDCGLDEAQPVELTFVDRWMVSRLQEAEQAVETGFRDYRVRSCGARDLRAGLGRVLRLVCRGRESAAAVGNLRLSREAHAGPLLRVLEAILRLAHPVDSVHHRELWQKVAPLAGRGGESIMLAPYPRAEPAKIDSWAVEQMGLLKELTNACRTLRSEIDLPPGQRVPLLAAGERSQLTPLFPVHADDCTAVAGEVWWTRCRTTDAPTACRP
jgi:valyl-tRNA synthetase